LAYGSLNRESRSAVNSWGLHSETHVLAQEMSVSSNYFSVTARTTRTCFWQVNPRHDKCTYRNVATAISREINRRENKQMRK